MGKLIEGLWDCQYCKSKGIKGRYYKCLKCGHPRNVDTHFYLPDKKDYVIDEKTEKINKNPLYLLF